MVGIGKPQVCTVLDTCFAGGGQHLAQQLDHTLVCADRFLFGIQGGFVPGGVLRADGVFAEFSRAIQLLGPFLHLVRNGMGGLLGQTHMRGRMRGQDGDLCEVLDGLVCGHAHSWLTPCRSPR